ncbi:DUF5949 family protein [Streptomyces tubbatahanensis]|uniref:DUF5949 family protein n=1 Tax=Streptomyces tubbatahanensis TaxID=2923272 RepID=A0ABY3XX34_9ACTN|nr:DUF5949 family protein [Streptomyces tubbatahanensis]UNS98965.1 DUF5949 family protein [Streptomyces tubbatahanensis]
MTSPQAAQSGTQQRDFGTLTVLGWAGEYGDGRDMAFLLVYSLGDGAGGRAATVAAMHKLAQEAGLPVGTEAVDAAAAGRRFPVTLIVEGGQAALTMPKLTAQYPAPPEWVAAARERGQVYFMLATTPWPQAPSGAAVGEQALREYVSEEMMSSAAHCLLPVRTLAG